MEDPLAEQKVSENEAEIGLSEKVEPIKCQLLYILMLAFTCMNESMINGYTTSLITYFIEEKVPSEERSLLFLFTFSLIFMMFIGPITDNYYLPWMGKRKTYILPGKIINTAAFLLMSFFIDNLVEEKKVMPISYFFVAISLIMLF